MLPTTKYSMYASLWFHRHLQNLKEGPFGGQHYSRFTLYHCFDTITIDHISPRMETSFKIYRTRDVVLKERTLSYHR